MGTIAGSRRVCHGELPLYSDELTLSTASTTLQGSSSCGIPSQDAKFAEDAKVEGRKSQARTAMPPVMACPGQASGSSGGGSICQACEAPDPLRPAAGQASGSRGGTSSRQANRFKKHLTGRLGGRFPPVTEANQLGGKLPPVTEASRAAKDIRRPLDKSNAARMQRQNTPPTECTPSRPIDFLAPLRRCPPLPARRRYQRPR